MSIKDVEFTKCYSIIKLLLLHATIVKLLCIIITDNILSFITGYILFFRKKIILGISFESSASEKNDGILYEIHMKFLVLFSLKNTSPPHTHMQNKKKKSCD